MTMRRRRQATCTYANIRCLPFHPSMSGNPDGADRMLGICGPRSLTGARSRSKEFSRVGYVSLFASVAQALRRFPVGCCVGLFGTFASAPIDVLNSWGSFGQRREVLGMSKTQGQPGDCEIFLLRLQMQ